MFDLLVHVNHTLGIAMIIVTHDMTLAALAHRRLTLKQGQLTPTHEAS